MSIKMRSNNDEDAICKVCGNGQDNSLGMFDIAFTKKHIITICDDCNNQLFSKTLKASCMINAKLKKKKDLDIIAIRKGRKMY